MCDKGTIAVSLTFDEWEDVLVGLELMVEKLGDSLDELLEYDDIDLESPEDLKALDKKVKAHNNKINAVKTLKRNLACQVQEKK